MVQQKLREDSVSFLVVFVSPGPQCGSTISKKRNNLCPLNWWDFVSTAVRCCDCAASSQQLYFYEHSQWKAHLCFFPGSGDSFPLALSKNRYRTQTIYSPERPGGISLQMVLCFWTFSLRYKENPPSFFHILGYKLVHVIFFLSFFSSSPGFECDDITDQMWWPLPFRGHKCDLNKLQWKMYRFTQSNGMKSLQWQRASV